MYSHTSNARLCAFCYGSRGSQICGSRLLMHIPGQILTATLPESLFTHPGNMRVRIRERRAQHQSLFHCIVTTRRGRGHSYSSKWENDLSFSRFFFDKLLENQLYAPNLHAQFLCMHLLLILIQLASISVVSIWNLSFVGAN